SVASPGWRVSLDSPSHLGRPDQHDRDALQVAEYVIRDGPDHRASQAGTAMRGHEHDITVALFRGLHDDLAWEAAQDQCFDIAVTVPFEDLLRQREVLRGCCLLGFDDFVDEPGVNARGGAELESCGGRASYQSGHGVDHLDDGDRPCWVDHLLD